MKKKKLRDFGLLESFAIARGEKFGELMKRVPGGWIHYLVTEVGVSTEFIPFSNEFLDEEVEII